MGGNLALKPEKATTLTLGAVLTPRFLPGFSASVDWYDIKVKNTIQTVGADTIVTTCVETANPLFCSFVHRDQFGSLWRTPQGYIVDQTVNIGSVKTRGIDVSANYNYHWTGVGGFSLSMNGTWLDKFVTTMACLRPMIVLAISAWSAGLRLPSGAIGLVCPTRRNPASASRLSGVTSDRRSLKRQAVIRR